MFSVSPITIAFWVEPEDGFWVKIVGNKVHWNEVYINDANADEEIVAEMLKAAYDDEGRFLLQKISRLQAEDFLQGHHHSSDECAYLISCGSI